MVILGCAMGLIYHTWFKESIIFGGREKGAKAEKAETEELEGKGKRDFKKTAKKYRLIFTDMPPKPLKTNRQYGTMLRRWLDCKAISILQGSGYGCAVITRLKTEGMAFE